MSRNPVTVSPDDSLAVAIDRMRAGRFRRLPVVDGGNLVGILTDRDVRGQAMQADRTKVGGVMTRDPITVAPLTPLEVAAKILIEKKLGGLPVVEDGKLVGVITSTDVIDAFLDVLGAFEEGSSRIDLLLDQAHDLSGAAQVIYQTGGEVLGVGTYREKWRKAPLFYLRVRCPEVGQAALALKGKGFTVLGMHT